MGQKTNVLVSSLDSGKAVGTELTQGKIQRLDAIGMIWDFKYDRAWKRAYQEAKAYFEIHGNLRVASTYVSESGFRVRAMDCYTTRKRQRVV